MIVQCKGSGRSANVGINVKRVACPACGAMQDVASNSNIRKHTRMVTKKQLRRL